MSVDTVGPDFLLIQGIRKKIALTVFGLLAFFLFSSEFINAVFNNTLDALNINLLGRIVFAFKPMVVGLFVFLSVSLYLIIMLYLKPLLNFLGTGKDYQRARSAAINIPWVIIIFQLSAWSLGTTIYYLLNGWHAESGIPFVFGLLLKVGIGLPSGVYISILFNIILIPAKIKLGIIEMRLNEDDVFSRWRDVFAVIGAMVYITINYSYIIYYYTNASVAISFGAFYVPLLFLGLFLAAVSVGLILLSKLEYYIQIESIQSVLRDMAAGRTKGDDRIRILNFNELGKIAAYVNTILDYFAGIFNRINEAAKLLADSSQRLSTVSQENAAYSNQQAASTAEIVSTMEDLNKLSIDIGRQVKQVEEMSVTMKEGVNDGYTITKENIIKMKEVTDSYTQTIGSIKDLGNQIAGIWEIVKIINSIAGQIKIIAFNAALEASSAGEAGKNFEIVAGEIRRLADSTVSSTNEIRSKISDIQHSSDSLIRSSEEDTQKIQAAWSMSNKIESVFDTILSSSESSSESAATMRTAVEQQICAFEQVLLTLRQIAEGIHEFTVSIEESSSTADALEDMVKDLNTIMERSTERKYT